MRIRTSRPLVLAATLALLTPLSAIAASTEPGTTQTSPLATQPQPTTAGGGQAAVGAAVTGSAPAPGTSAPADASQAQQGVMLKQGSGAGDMGAASGATAPTDQQPKKP